MTLIFVYSGKLPKFTYYSLKHALKSSGIKVHLVVDSKPDKSILSLKSLGLILVDSNSFYFRPNFLDSHLIDLKYFRGEFWTKTLERVLILEQYVKKFNIQKFFHGELDNLFFDLKNLSYSIDNTGNKGIFIPRIDADRMIASILYCNDVNELIEFCQFVSSNFQNKDEMQLLSDWQNSPRSNFFTLKSNILENELDMGPLYEKESGLTSEIIFDGARFGQWLFGEDPRNKLGVFRNLDLKFIRDHMEVSKCYFSYENGKVFIVYNDKSFILKNLHVHSKIIKKLTSNNGLNYIFDRTREKKRTIISLNFYSYFNLIIRIFHRIRFKPKFFINYINRNSM
jgi:hypothetical protein